MTFSSGGDVGVRPVALDPTEPADASDMSSMMRARSGGGQGRRGGGRGKVWSDEPRGGSQNTNDSLNL
jgi:hypothetical protein